MKKSLSVVVHCLGLLAFGLLAFGLLAYLVGYTNLKFPNVLPADDDDKKSGGQKQFPTKLMLFLSLSLWLLDNWEPIVPSYAQWLE